MEFSESKTYANLLVAFSGESQARNKYTYYAAQAKQNGYIQISDIFTETANNEKEHAEIWFNLLHGNSTPSTEKALADAADGEFYEFSEMYKEFAEVAKEEGYTEIAALFNLVGKIEKEHHDRFKKLEQNVAENKVFEKGNSCIWICTNCGHVHVGQKAPMSCPVCKKPQAYFKIKEDNY